MTIIPQYASVVNRVYFQFLQGLPAPTPQARAAPDPEGVCREGLARLAALADDARLASRDPRTTLSFCRYSREVVQQNVALFAEFAQGEENALHPLDEYGRPVCK